MKYEKRLNIENSAMQGDTWTIVCVCVCVGDEAHLLLAVKLAARAMPGSRFFRLVGESMLPVLRELECGGKALGWSSLTVENKQSLHPEILQNTTI